MMPFDSKSVLYGLTASLLVFVALFITFVTLYAKLKETCVASGSSNFANSSPSKVVNADNIVSNIAIQHIATLPIAQQTNVTLSTNNSCTNFSLEGTFQPSHLYLQEMQMQNSSNSSLQVSSQQPLFVSTNAAEYTLQKEDTLFLFKGSFTNDTVLSLASELKQSVTACLTHV